MAGTVPQLSLGGVMGTNYFNMFLEEINSCSSYCTIATICVGLWVSSIQHIDYHKLRKQ